jgi:hypothetical protein
MGLIHSRASKKRAKEEAKLLKEQRKQLKAQGKRDGATARQEAAGDNPLRQPTLGGAIGALQRQRQQRQG